MTTQRPKLPPIGPNLASTGIRGLDKILGGGFATRRLHLVEGVPGAGKTTLALQFLLEGVKQDETCLYVTLSETKEELESVAASHGWDLSGIQIREVIPSEESLLPDQQYTLFHPSEVELGTTVRRILDEVDAVQPARVVFDSLSELRLLAGNPLRYRRQILALKQFFAGRECTVLMLDDQTTTQNDLDVQSIAHGVVLLEQMQPGYGAERRRMRVVKMRGLKFHGGNHDFIIKSGGLQVFPRLVSGDWIETSAFRRISTGVKEFDQLLGGGLELGTSTLIAGAAGSGKSSLAAQIAVAAADQGVRSSMFIFDESRQTLVSRMRGMFVPLEEQIENGMISIQKIDPAEFSPGEFTHRVLQSVDEGGARVVVIDSLNGFLSAMIDERFVSNLLHELLMSLGQRQVATIVVGVHAGLIGPMMNTPVDASYLADAVILLRYFEAGGEVRQALSVMKKRGSSHERTIREFRLGKGGLEVGPPLREFRGVLTGVPNYEGTSAPLLKGMPKG
jgi:circadian clock protein KaiC